MSDSKPSKTRKAGVPLNPELRLRLRPVPRTEELPRPVPDPELRAALADMQRRSRVQHERLEVDPDEPEAA